jgi:hypothetical protein
MKLVGVLIHIFDHDPDYLLVGRGSRAAEIFAVNVLGNARTVAATNESLFSAAHNAFMVDLIGRLICPKYSVDDYQTRKQEKARHHASDYSVTSIVGVGWVRVHRKHGVLL